jgi:hypothetical protein
MIGVGEEPIATHRQNTNNDTFLPIRIHDASQKKLWVMTRASARAPSAATVLIKPL